jgi:CubicO group peptidase (beta-lactamase class C family)
MDGQPRDALDAPVVEHRPRGRGSGTRPSRLRLAPPLVLLVTSSLLLGSMVVPGSGTSLDAGGRADPRVITTSWDTDADALRTVATATDEAIVAAMSEHGMPGGVFVLVADGSIVHAEGYGHTDAAGTTPVDAQRTRFDIGSVSKLLAATAVMQQVEQGALDLTSDVNDHLAALTIPDTFPEPITPAHLLTHTAGFGEYYLLGSAAPGPGEADPLADSLTRFLPPRIRPPGIEHQYDNFGIALAGHLVEVASGVAYEDYVTDRILEPLGMVNSTFGRPVPGTVDAVPHEALPGTDGAGEVPPMYVNSIPTGGLWTTGEDIAAFMLAYLGGGEHDGARILEADTVDAMFTTQFTPHPQLAGIGYGFFEHLVGERRGVQHGGSWVGASAHLYLLPDADLGMFVAFNHGSGVEVTHTVIYDALDALFPVEPPTVAVGADLDASGYAGQYRWNRHDTFTFMRVVSTLGGIRMEVTANDDGTLDSEMAPVGLLPETRWVASEPGVFIEEGGTSTLVFAGDDAGDVTGLHVAGPQLFTMDRLAWYETTGFVLALLLLFLVAALIAAVGWPAGAVVRRVRHTEGAVPTDLRRARRLAGIAGGLYIAFVVGMFGHFIIDMGGLVRVSPVVQALLWLPLISVLLTAGLVWFVIRLWRSGDGGTVPRVYLSSITVALVAFVPFLWHLRLLGFHY